MKNKLFLTAVIFSFFGIVHAQVTQSTSDLSSQATYCGDLEALFTTSGSSIHNLMYADVGGEFVSKKCGPDKYKRFSLFG
jgi:hypothetical protein